MVQAEKKTADNMIMRNIVCDLSGFNGFQRGGKFT
jgi:hypothetical protein